MAAPVHMPHAPSEIVVLLRPNLAEALRSPSSRNKAAVRVTALLGAFKAALAPDSDPMKSPEGAEYRWVEMPDQTHAAELIDALGKISGVEAAYIKGGVSPP